MSHSNLKEINLKDNLIENLKENNIKKFNIDPIQRYFGIKIENTINARLLSNPEEFSQFNIKIEDIDPQEAKNENRLYHLGKIEFNEKISNIVENNELTNDEKIIQLENLLKSMDLNNTPTYQIMTIFNEFKKLSSFANLIFIYERVNNDDFKQSEIVQELCAVAYNKIGQPDKAIEICHNMIDRGIENGEIYGALGKAYLLKGLTEESFFAYNEGFRQHFEFYPGINAAYRLIDLGKISQAKKLAKMVYLSCERDGGIESGDYWCVVTMLESACIMGQSKEKIEDLVNKVLSIENPAWQLESTLGYLKPFVEKSKKLGENIDYLEKNVIEKLEDRLNKIKANDSNKNSYD